MVVLVAGFTVIVWVAVVAHCPASGVKVYSVVTKLFTSGDQFPVNPLVEMFGKASITTPEQIGSIALNVGVNVGITSTVISFLQVTPLTVTSHQ